MPRHPAGAGPPGTAFGRLLDEGASVRRILDRKLAAAAALALALLAINAALGWSNMRGVRDALEWVGRSREVLLGLSATLSAVADAETGQRGYVITGNFGYLDPYIAARRTLNNWRYLTGLDGHSVSLPIHYADPAQGAAPTRAGPAASPARWITPASWAAANARGGMSPKTTRARESRSHAASRSTRRGQSSMNARQRATVPAVSMTSALC